MKGSYYCERCEVRDRALCSAVSESAAADLRRIAHHKRVPAGQVIHSEHQGLSWLAVIGSGVIKLVKSQRDGRQQIVGLQFPGDFVGRPHSAHHTLIAEATTTLDLCCFSRSAFEDLMQKHPSLERALLKRALDDLEASREWMFLLGRKTAREKVASLLAAIAVRLMRSQADAKPSALLQFDLPLSRNEIADALGLTIETVSREVRFLKSAGLIATSGRRNLTVYKLDDLNAVAEGEGA
jgi:CRP/FNR family transcriptional regulator